jgi:hypothetical protein
MAVSGSVLDRLDTAQRFRQWWMAWQTPVRVDAVLYLGRASSS